MLALHNVYFSLGCVGNTQGQCFMVPGVMEACKGREGAETKSL